MGDELIEWVDRQIDATGLDEEVGLVVLAALTSEAELDAFLDGGNPPRRTDRGAGQVAAAAEAGGTFLTAIEVEGFRGIGPTTRLSLDPRPGLTIVAGRNGSGKSSLSEALELVLTGDTYRWRQKSGVSWREQWRNLHHPHAAITIGLVEEGEGALEVRARWAAGVEDVGDRTLTAQRPGRKQLDSVAALGWEGPLEQYRPILSYDELGKVLDSGRSQLYDALAGILGVEQLKDGLMRISSRLKSRKAPGAAATAERKAVLTAAQELDDDRARQAVPLLKKPTPDAAALAELEALATGSSTPDQGPAATLRALAQLTLPFDSAAAATATDRLRRAADRLVTTAADTSLRTRARLDLLEQALVVHSEHGDMACPVCAQGSLDGAWHETRSAEVRAVRSEFSELDQARQDLDLAVRAVRGLVTPTPSTLHQSLPPEVAELADRTRVAWDDWAGARDLEATATHALADHVDTRVSGLVDSVTALRAAASAELEALHDRWQPVATRIAAWVATWRAWLCAKPTVDTLTAAEKWLKDNDLRLKNERLAPIEEGAKRAWAKLRQESNVDIGSLSLAGTNTSRHVRIESTVDGVDSTIAVLSQGELHALALALFLPRATMADSPFRFLVLDDPVQAMDPAKVDGLVEVLGEIAQHRQVVVFSHDDRLASAVRRSPTPATVVEVSRGKDSRVGIRTSLDPARRYLDDGFGLIREHEHDRLTESALRRTLPGLIRFAVEVAARDAFFVRRLRSGAALADVEEAWNLLHTTRHRVLTAVYDAVPPDHEASSWSAVPYRKNALKTAGASFHHGLPAGVDPRGALQDAQRLVNELKGLVP